MISFKFNWIIYGLGKLMQLRGFVWVLRFSVWVMVNHFLLIDATVVSKISRQWFQIQLEISTYTPFHFSRTLPLKLYWI